MNTKVAIIRSPWRRHLESIFAVVVAIAFAAIGVAAFVAEAEPSPHLTSIVILDVSGSQARATLCDDLASIVRQATTFEGWREITILATGDRSSGFQPTRVGTFSLAPSMRVLEGAVEEAEAEARVLASSTRLCAALPTKQASPLFAALDAGIRSFATAECGKENRVCQIWMRTDGIEEHDATLVRAYQKPREQRVARLSNENIDVTICSLSERHAVGTRRLPTLGEIDDALRREFTAPERVALLPNCTSAAARAEVTR